MKVKRSKQPFSPGKRLLSFKFALNGILYMLKTQHNFWIHLVAAGTVVFAGFYFGLSTMEWVLICLTIGGVLTAESLNTAIELLVDKVSPEFNKKAGLIKDVAAGAVLILSIAAAITGALIFIPKIVG